ncbi:Pimeloyl-ACP methyl ester carboxylesterase [Methylobacterium phyllostachyos]|uniref:Pimeloyl-ACP methyl ester carboxylesterase n=1 Tax=Methylobacterium phyllostachyos TaxID=582672 RepID=A0A1G9VQV8_9HYPH|nr:alpha/beta hydrolase [Methylobacterium phyllostachyos]SDM74559.1 Pimeloyl-ACP methyl ester carboxylesterase [Methylobacterium phyllostachyos]
MLGILLAILALPVALTSLVLLVGAAASLWITLRVGAAYPTAGPFVAVTGGRLATIQDGPAAGPPIVLLHGASANASDPMEGVGRRLAARGFRVIAFDRPGFGWSDRIAGADAAAPAVQARLIAEALERMGIGPAIVFGHSWSGALALALALDHPERVAGLVLAAPVALPMPDRRQDLPFYWRIAVAPPVAWLLSRTIGPPLAQYFLPEAARRVFTPQAANPDYPALARADLVLRPGTLLANVQDLLGLSEALSAQSPRYGTLRVPTLVISGEADPIVRSDLQAVPLARAIPGARLVLLPGIGHMLQYVASERVVEEIARLSDDLKGASTALPAATR